MQCDYFDAGSCRSCTLMGTAYASQLADKQASVAEILAGHVAPGRWLPPVANREDAFRNKAKLVVGGTKTAPTLGILDQDDRGVDLRGCGLYEPGLDQSVRRLAELLPGSGLTPYDVRSRQGELKHLLVTHSPDGELMVRLVLRSPGQLRRVEELVPRLREALPGTRVVSVNLQPEHAAVLEGPEEIVLTEQDTLPMRLGPITLHLGTRSFFQTSTPMAAALYAQARAWAEEVAPRTVWDLYCGVGGFALHLAAPGRTVTGVELSAEAVRSARRSADEAGFTGVELVAADATRWASGTAPEEAPDLVVVNPPRRGIGADLCGWLESARTPWVVYSSCNADSLARDLARMPSLAVEQARLVDMFPQTRHHEVMVLLRRRSVGGDW